MINKENYLQNIPPELRQYKQWLWFKRIVRVDKWGKEKKIQNTHQPNHIKIRWLK